MRILAIETSCDETAISIIEANKEGKKVKFKILGNEVSSQIALHTQYGGVFPMMAKREHGKNIISVLEKSLKEAKLHKLLVAKNKISTKEINKIQKILEREEYLLENFINKISEIKKPDIDVIAVTVGPGLEPALWVGISFAKALSTYWNIPIVPVNHMEGHIFSIFPKKTKSFTVDVKEKMFPMLSLLVSGGHTELVLVKDWQKYKKIGQTRDDAAGEAFDKVARMLGLPYPGGPEISKMADIDRQNSSELFKFSGPRISSPKYSSLKIEAQPDHKKLNNSLPFEITLPRPMIHSKDYDFSFSGLKTAVLYLVRDLKIKNPNILEDINIKQKIAREFEDATIETLVYKTTKAIKEYKIKTLIVGGGVSANSYLQKVMAEKIQEGKYKTKVYFPSKSLTGDNALMIAISGYFQAQDKKFAKNLNKIVAQGNLSL